MLFSTEDSFSYVFEKPKMEDFFSLTRRLRNCSEAVFFYTEIVLYGEQLLFKVLLNNLK